MIVVKNKVIYEDVLKILNDVRSNLTNGKLRDIYVTGDNIKVTCPFHAGGHERHPSCYVRIEDGVFHCFTDGLSGGLAKFIGGCFDSNEAFGTNWLLSHYETDVLEDESLLSLEEIVVNKEDKEEFLDEHVLDSFVDYHPYMTKRKLSREIINKFNVKYDPYTRCLVFPVRDIKGRLKYLTRRSVDSKRFIIDKNASKKDIYLLNEAKNYDTVVVCESQINCLTCWSYGIPAIALIGAGTTQDQIDTLNKTCISHYVLAYDGDYAGKSGANKFKRLIRNDVLVTTMNLPTGKDVNDLSKEEFMKYYNEASW